LPWYGVYNLIEHIASSGLLEPVFGETKTNTQLYIRHVNAILAAERSGYRFLDGKIVPLSNSAEVAAVAEAVSSSARPGLEGVNEHLKKALSALGQKPKPDYHNAIKDAVLAVEATARLLGANEGDGLDRPLTILAEKTKLDPAMKKAFLALYGYSSGPKGIRHAMMDQSDVGFDEAKFMVIACSAFVNFLITKAAVAGLLKSGAVSGASSSPGSARRSK